MVSNPTPGHISGENHRSKRYVLLNVHISTTYNSQDRTQCPLTEGWIKVYFIHTHTRILLSHKKEGESAICSNKDGPRDYNTK